MTAVGRELSGFIWAIETTVETVAGRARGVAASLRRRTRHAMAVAIERRTHAVFYAAGMMRRFGSTQNPNSSSGPLRATARITRVDYERDAEIWRPFLADMRKRTVPAVNLMMELGLSV